MQFVSFVLLAATLLVAQAQEELPGGAATTASAASDYPSTKDATKQADYEETPATAASAQQHLRRANVFNSNSSYNGNGNGKINVVVVLKDEGRRRKLSGNGHETAAERKAAAEENMAAAAAAASSMGANATFTYGTALYGFAASIPSGLLKKIEADPRVKSVDEDATVQLDPIELGGDRRRLAQTTPWGISRVKGGATYTGTGRAWVIDTGIDLDHPDLNVDKVKSKTYAGKTPDDENGHGTHVAGTIAAINNSIGVVGVAAGAPVVAVRVLDRRGSGSISGVIKGVDYVAQNCVSSDVANMSLGGSYYKPLNDAVIAASGKCPFFIAAGNSGDNAEKYSPASANGPNVYTVSAFKSGDTWASFSNHGSVVDYAEPGVSIYSTWKGGGYNTISGTSMATPHLAGVKLVGSITTDGTVNNDPDGKPDPIGVC